MRRPVAALVVIAAGVLACSEISGGDGDTRVDLCAHAPGAAWSADSAGAACIPYPHAHAGEVVSLVVEAVNRAGPARTVNLAVSSGLPQGWTATLGGSTISVPGQQTLSINIAAGTPAEADYPISLTASGPEENDQIQIKIRVVQ